MSYKIVLTDYEFPDLGPETEVFARAGLTLTPNQARTEDELIAACAGADAVLNQYAQLTPRVIRSLDKCRIISRYGIGLNTIDVPTATELGIYIGNVPDGSLEEVSDHAIALLLAVVRGLVKFDTAVKAGKWDYTVVKPLYRVRGKTLGLLSFGNIARKVAVKMAGFGVRIIAHDPYADAAEAKAMGVELVDLETLCRESDYLSVHVPLVEQTRHILSRDQFAVMKPTAIVVNTARGPVIDEAALIAALSEKRLAGAGLDVFETEPVRGDNPLLAMDNVVLSSHAAWYSEDSEYEIRSKTAQNVVDVLQGREPTYLANPDVAGHARARAGQ
ncbi:C-terminal binding protein [Pelagibacterium lacus]|uniref:C-terminal binding protein n=1 Tax=Pelagibacterium lacus TaxID=2282655 RepID=A0A369W657_9HYPH|nr:C-terminal binding protein [Pelagibacterium lacus]RDE10154.1 C-terminal binding protein [Pelagibacterium lacus]